MAKPKPTYRDPHTQIRNDVLINLCRANLPKRDYYRFLMILFRETFGRKRQQGSALGKWMEWEPSVWTNQGMDKAIVSRCKKDLLDLRVIRRNGTKIGFNWHAKHWKCSWYVPPQIIKPSGVSESGKNLSDVSEEVVDSPINNELTQRSTVDPAINTSSCLSDQQLLTHRSTKVDSPINTTPPRAASDAGLQSVKKQRNKETILGGKNSKKKKTEQGPTEYTEAFEKFWSVYPRKIDKSKAFGTFQDYYKQNLFTLDDLIGLVEKNNKELWYDREQKFIPLCVSWLNRRPWEDITPGKPQKKLSHIEAIQLQDIIREIGTLDGYIESPSVYSPEQINKFKRQRKELERERRYYEERM